MSACWDELRGRGCLALSAGLLGFSRTIIPWPASHCLATQSAPLWRQTAFRRIMSSSCSSSPTCISSGLRANIPLRGNFPFSLSVLVHNMLLNHWLIIQSPLLPPDYLLVQVTLQHILGNKVPFFFLLMMFGGASSARTVLLTGESWWLRLELEAPLCLGSLGLPWSWGAAWVDGL